MCAVYAILFVALKKHGGLMGTVALHACGHAHAWEELSKPVFVVADYGP
jgi:hypothetical protein